MAVSVTLAATGQTEPELATRLDISLSGTWTGTAKLQRKVGITGWVDTGDSWTTNVETYLEGASMLQYRIDWTRSSGSLVVNLIGAP